MKVLYWPCAKYMNGSGAEYDLITYEGCDTLEAAKRQIQFWADAYGFILTEAHIDAYPPSGKVCVAALNLREGTWGDVQ